MEDEEEDAVDEVILQLNWPVAGKAAGDLVEFMSVYQQFRKREAEIVGMELGALPDDFRRVIGEVRQVEIRFGTPELVGRTADVDGNTVGAVMFAVDQLVRRHPPLESGGRFESAYLSGIVLRNAGGGLWTAEFSFD